MKIESTDNLARRIDRRDTGSRVERTTPPQLQLGDTVVFNGKCYVIHDFQHTTGEFVLIHRWEEVPLLVTPTELANATR